MKTTLNFKLLALIGLLFSSITFLNAQCLINSSFTFTDNGNGNISFTNTSTGNYQSSYWDFGDGNNSTVNSPTHNYLTSGTFNVLLTVYDSTVANCGDTSIIAIPITVNSPCGNALASFTVVNNGSGNYTFTNTSTGYGNPAYYYWNFGDGNFINTQNQSVNHTYITNGNFNVSFGIYAPNCGDSIWQPITVNNTSCQNDTASFTYTAGSNGNITFTNTSTGNITSGAFWSFGDGNYSHAIPNNNNITHQYNASGWYYVCLLADTIDSCSVQFCDSIYVPSSSPCANALASFTVTDNGGGNYTFTNTSTGYATPTYYYWNFGDGNFINTQNQSVNHTYTTGGNFNVSFGIYGPNCSDSIWQPITVNTTPCSINAGFNYTDNGGGSFSFNSTATGNIAYHYWNFGDGNTSTQISPSHTYNTNGTYPVQQIVFDTNNVCTDMYIHAITVTGVSNPLSCNASFIMFPDSNNNVTVLNTSTGNNLAYFWDFGDGNTSTQAFPSYTYNTVGPFLLCLTVTDGNCSSTYCDSISSGGIVLKQAGFTVNVQTHTGTGLNENFNVISNLNTYPNPVKDQLTIELNLTQQANLNITITDVLGNIVDVIDNSNLSSGANKLYWNTNKVSNGVYLLQVNGKNTTDIKKLIINR